MKAAVKVLMNCGWKDDESHSFGGGRRRSCQENMNHLKLNSTEMTFTKSQLDALNRYLADMCDFSPPEKSINCYQGQKEIADVVERLVQRLICGVAALDSRFSSKFLIRLHEKSTNSELDLLNRYEYLIRLDKISTPFSGNESDDICSRIVDDVEIENLPQGYVKIHLQGETSAWSEFLTPNGFLRRDKIQEKFVELLALSAGGSSPQSPNDTDETKHCGAPGKVADADIVYQILQMPAANQIFYGATGSDELRYPDPRDFRMAIVEEPAGVRLRISFLSPTLHRHGDVEVYLIIGVGFDGWPRSSDFPHRIDLTHPDFILYYKAAQMGMYAVSIAPSHALRCESKSSIWRLCFPAARITLKTHYGPGSLPQTILDVLYEILERLNRQDRLKLVSKNILMVLLWFELEKSYDSPSQLLMHWLPETFSYHVLKILDKLVISLRNGFQRSYFFAQQNMYFIANNCTDDDFMSDAEKIFSYMEHLYEESTLIQRFDHDKVIQDRVHTELVIKWVQVMSDISPPTINRSTRLSFNATDTNDANALSAATTQFSKKQLEYFRLMFSEVLKIQEIVSGNPFIFFDDSKLTFLINFILDHAVAFSKKYNRKNKNNTFICKINMNIEISKENLFEAINKEIKVHKINFENDLILVSHVLKWLYRALDEDKRFLAPILRPFLQRLFVASYENSWHLDAWKRRQELDEMNILATFCSIVNSNGVQPRVGIIDAANKGWYWAQDILEIIQEFDLNLILTPNNLGTVQHHLKGSKKNSGFNTLKNQMTRNFDFTLRNQNVNKWLSTATLPLKHTMKPQFFDGDMEERNSKYLLHSHLRDSSPMTKIIESTRRYGQYRCLGDIIEAFIILNKFSILQEISTFLPESDRLHMLDTIHRISKGTRRRHFRTLRTRSHTNLTDNDLMKSSGDPKRLSSSSFLNELPLRRNKKNSNDEKREYQTYRPSPESFLHLIENGTRKASDPETPEKSTNKKSIDCGLDLPFELEQSKENDIKHNWQSLVTSNYFEDNFFSKDTPKCIIYEKNNIANISKNENKCRNDSDLKNNWQTLVKNNFFESNDETKDETNLYKKVIQINSVSLEDDDKNDFKFLQKSQKKNLT